MQYTSGKDPMVRTIQALAVLAVATTSGQIMAVECPYPQGCYLRRAHADKKVASTGACVVDIGKAANATTSADNLIDGASIASTGLLDSTNDTDNGANGSPATVLWLPGEFVTVTVVSGDANGATLGLTLEVIPRVV